MTWIILHCIQFMYETWKSWVKFQYKKHLKEKKQIDILHCLFNCVLTQEIKLKMQFTAKVNFIFRCTD